MYDEKFTIDKHIAITAGAGTGKTYTLSRRYINALLGFDLFTQSAIPVFPEEIEQARQKAAKPIEIVTTTFTEAGAMEMRSRIESFIVEIISIMEGKSQLPDNFGIDGISSFSVQWKEYISHTLQEALYEIHLALISTIHRFALSIIRKNVELIPMDTTIDMIDENARKELVEKVWFDVINQAQNQEDYLKLNDVYSLYNVKSFAQMYTLSTQTRDGFDKFVATIETDKNLPQIYLKLFFEQNIEKIIEAFDNYEESIKTKVEIEEVLKEYLDSVFLLKVTVLKDLAGIKSIPAPYGAIKAIFDTLQFKEDAAAEFINTIKIIHTLSRQTRALYHEALEKNGQLDFDRILEAANTLVKHPKANLREFKYFFVDEFQDTNDIQWNLIKNAARLEDKDKSANIFLVGDEKQSIFEFQGAQVSTFGDAIEDIKKSYGADALITPRMSRNFRSDKYIIDFVNSTFEGIMKKETTPPPKPSYTNPILNDFTDKVYSEYLKNSSKEYEVSYQKLESASDENGSVRVLIKQTPKLADEHKDTKLKYSTDAIALHEANMLAYFISQIQKGSYNCYEDIKKKIDNNEKAIGILCDGKKHMLLMKEALKKQCLESKVSASEDFYAAKEVIDVFYILAAIKYLKDDSSISLQANPDSDKKIDLKNSIAKQRRFFLAGALRSSILRYSDVRIKELFENGKIPRELSDLITLHNAISLPFFIDHIIKTYEVHRVYAHYENYPQRKANLKKLLHMATQFVPDKGKNIFDGFVDMLEKRILSSENSDEEQAFYESAQTNAIEIRTIHSAKGLSWPMVIVPELGNDLSGKPSTLNYASIKDGEKQVAVTGFSIKSQKNLYNELAKTVSDNKRYAEKKRLLYVAMTRPETHLVLSASKNEKDEFHKNSYWSRWLPKMSNILENKETSKDTKSQIEENQYIETKTEFTQNIDNHAIAIELYDVTLTDQESGEINEKSEFVVKKEEIFQKEEGILPIKQGYHPLLELDAIKTKQEIQNPFEASYAKDFGEHAHLLLELGYRAKVFGSDNEDGYIEDFIKTYEITEASRLKKAVANFKQSDIYSELQNIELVLFEQEYNFFDKEKNANQKRYIDLLYFHNDKWNIIDFKSNLLRDRDKEVIIAEHGYTEQLNGYREYVLHHYGPQSINRCQILWLEDGSLSDIKGVQ